MVCSVLECNSLEPISSTEIDGVRETLSFEPLWLVLTMSFYDNVVQSQKYTSSGTFQLFLKVFVPLASTRHIMHRGVVACAPTGFLQGDLTDRP